MTLPATPPLTLRLEFTLTDSNLGEGGRDRSSLEVYLNLGVQHAQHFGTDGFTVLTPDGDTFTCRPSGATAWSNVKRGEQPTPKNLRSVPGEALGRWLAKHKARPGDKIHAYLLEPKLWLFRFHAVDLEAERKRNAAAFAWDEVFAKTAAERAQRQRQGESAYYRGRGTRGTR